MLHIHFIYQTLSDFREGAGGIGKSDPLSVMITSRWGVFEAKGAQRLRRYSRLGGGFSDQLSDLYSATVEIFRSSVPQFSKIWNNDILYLKPIDYLYIEFYTPPNQVLDL